MDTENAKDIKKAKATWKETAQRHHDYYVRLAREKGLENLCDDDRKMYNLAMERERAGEVTSLPISSKT